MFKVGDKVKVIDAGKLYSAYKDFIKENAPQLLNKWEYERGLPDGGSYEVKAIGKHIWGNELAIIEQNNKVYIVDFKGLELVKPFTKSDLKDNHIVVYKSGEKYLWEDVCLKKNYTEDLIYADYDNATINEVYEFDKLVWKREEPILDEVEKRWLNHFIKSTNIKVNNITKYKSMFYNNSEYLEIDYNNSDDNRESIRFPHFKEDTMYKGMELDKKYTLEELGLE